MVFGRINRLVVFFDEDFRGAHAVWDDAIVLFIENAGIVAGGAFHLALVAFGFFEHDIVGMLVGDDFLGARADFFFLGWLSLRTEDTRLRQQE